MKRGRPFEPGNKFGRGRPRGSRNKKTLILQELLEEHAPALMRKSLVMALQGDVPLLRLFLDRKLLRPSDSPVKIGRLPMGTIEEVLQAHETVLNKLASGQVTPVQALQINSLLETRRELIETQDLARRVRALEQTAESGTGPVIIGSVCPISSTNAKRNATKRDHDAKITQE